MSLRLVYLLTTVALLPVGLALVLVLRRRGRVQSLVTRDLTTLALMICLLHVAVLPFKGGLAKIPGLDALVYSIPYTLVLLLGLQLVPKPGAASAIIAGQALLGQLLHGGLNPVMWPYHAWCALSAQAFSLSARRRPYALAATRGLVSYGYSYLVLAPLVWRKHYAPWFVGMKVGLGLVGCVIGAWLALRLAPRVERATANPMG